MRRRVLGQHFLNSRAVAETIVATAGITSGDVVYEVGTGRGVLTPLLCRQAGRVVSVDVDRDLVREARSRFGDVGNLVLEAGDGFGLDVEFDVFVSNLPYSQSREAVEWLACRQFSHGVVMVQREFAEKLAAASGDRRAISVIAAHAFDIERVCDVGRNNFSPPPTVDSAVLRIVKRAEMDRQLIAAVNRMFAYRRKTIRNMLKKFGIPSDDDRRIDDLDVEEIISLARQI